MTKLLMDHQTFDMQKFGGISRYFANIYHNLKSDKIFDAEISILKTDNFYLKSDSFSKNIFTNYILKKQRKQFKYNRKHSLAKIKENDFDIFHPTYYDPYFLESLRKPFVLTVHDMIHEIYPQYFYGFDEFAKFKRLTINKADHIIAISEATKADLQHFYAIPEEKITVIYHGVDLTPKENRVHLARLNSPYILYIGDRAGYKNFFRFLLAFKELTSFHAELTLVCSGSPFNAVETEFLTRNHLMNKVTYLSATDEELEALYQHALFYISPSLLEGFGFPILEAFANNCIVLLSDIACFREVAGDGAIYFNPLSVDDILQSMMHALQNRNNNILIDNGNRQLQKFSLEKSINETKRIYSNLINRHS